MMRILILILAVLVSNVSFGAEPNTLTAEDPALGQELQKIHERALQYKAGQLKGAPPNEEYLQELEKAIKSPACDYSSLFQKGGSYCPHCGLGKCLACSAALVAAVAACGGPEDLPCIAAALGAMSACIECITGTK
jgi:hypothetical protein